jgi:2-polyprenyl-3-methyl-5-hydroxy-6-metoxy-1,4-benzoquinol methylase
MHNVRERLYEAYASTHSGPSNAAATALIYRRDIRPHLPAQPGGHRVLDVGCGQGELVRLLHLDGFEAHGVDASPEQVGIARAAGCGDIALGDVFEYLESSRDSWTAILATDVLEHLGKEEVLRLFDHAHAALVPGGVFAARVPNAVSPIGGNVMFGDLTHETWFTRRSVAQLASVSGFARVQAFACPPVVHGFGSAARALLWKPISGLVKVALAAETGELRGHITTQNLTFVAHKGTLPVSPAARPVLHDG